jgi:hypothetical protein
MDKLLKHAAIAAFTLLLAGGLAACDKKGPMEQAGENIDNAATDAGNAIEDSCEKAKEAAGAEDTRC